LLIGVLKNILGNVTIKNKIYSNMLFYISDIFNTSFAKKNTALEAGHSLIKLRWKLAEPNIKASLGLLLQVKIMELVAAILRKEVVLTIIGMVAVKGDTVIAIIMA